MHHKVTLWACLLILLSVSICAYKVKYLKLPLQATQDTDVWTVQARLAFKGQGGPAKLNLLIPNTTPGYFRLDEDFISGDFGLAVTEQADNRVAKWAVRRTKGMQVLYYRATLVESQENTQWTSQPKFPQIPEYPEPYASAITKLLSDVRRESADVNTYTRELLLQLNAEAPNEHIELIRDRAANATQWIQEIINILKGVRIPARILWGLEMAPMTNNGVLKPLLQVHNGQGWHTFDPVTAVSGLPDNYLVWHLGDRPLFQAEGVVSTELSFAVMKNPRDVIEVSERIAAEKSSSLLALSPLALPVQTQNLYRILLMVPLGALVVAFLRTFVGIKTFGTFMPVLLALAFRETQLAWGLVLLVAIVAFGLAIRFFLERLHLLLIPRLTSVVVIVVLLMLGVSLVTHALGIDRVLSVALFPIVILAMTIERMSIVWEESGMYEALLQGLGSVCAACLGYWVMTRPGLNYLVFAFPELLLIVLAASLWMGRYTGYRLSELWRFKMAQVSDR